MRTKFLITVAFIFLGNLKIEASPGTYYNSLDTTTSCASFKTALFNLIKNDSHLDYGLIDNSYYRTDVKLSENGNGKNVLMERYCSENPFGLDYCFFNPDSICSGGSTFCQCYNKEHVVPKGWFNGSADFSVKQYTDMQFVWPSDSKVNGSKSNYPLGYTTTPILLTSLNGTKIGSSDVAKNFGYSSSNVFEPIDTFKGDFARAYLYFVTRYQDSTASFKRNPIAVNVFSATSYTGLEPWILQLCVKWHKMDPPSDFERKRNDSVYAIQGNRNPYVDYPHWVEKVFGVDGNAAGCTSSSIRNNPTIVYTVYPNPAQDKLNILFSRNLSKITTIEILDIVGETIFTQTISEPQLFFTINTLGYAKGLYVLNIKYDGGNNITKFLIE